MRRPGAVAAAAFLFVIAGCVAEPSVTTQPTATSTPTPTVTPSPSLSPTDEPTEPATATPTAEPTLSLEPPEGSDERVVAVATSIDMPRDADGRIVVTVTSAADSMIDELVLRWPEALHEALFPAPFVPSDDRIRDGGPPLRQEWTKWVVGPGERGEPAGTVSLGYGPLPAGGRLEIELFVERRADRPVAFDLQVLSGEDLLTLETGEPAVLRIEVP